MIARSAVARLNSSESANLPVITAANSVASHVGDTADAQSPSLVLSPGSGTPTKPLSPKFEPNGKNVAGPPRIFSSGASEQAEALKKAGTTAVQPTPTSADNNLKWKEESSTSESIKDGNISNSYKFVSSDVSTTGMVVGKNSAVTMCGMKSTVSIAKSNVPERANTPTTNKKIATSHVQERMTYSREIEVKEASAQGTVKRPGVVVLDSSSDDSNDGYGSHGDIGDAVFSGDDENHSAAGFGMLVEDMMRDRTTATGVLLNGKPLLQEPKFKPVVPARGPNNTNTNSAPGQDMKVSRDLRRMQKFGFGGAPTPRTPSPVIPGTPGASRTMFLKQILSLGEHALVHDYCPPVALPRIPESFNTFEE